MELSVLRYRNFFLLIGNLHQMVSARSQDVCAILRYMFSFVLRRYNPLSKTD